MAIKSFKPYKKEGSPAFWFFDDKRKGFKEEPFLLGFSDVLNDLVLEFIKEDVNDFHLLISDSEFPGQSAHGTMVHVKDDGGSCYKFASPNLQTQICVISNFSYKYFAKAIPETLYLRVERTVKW